jgi:hypothetical protein
LSYLQHSLSKRQAGGQIGMSDRAHAPKPGKSRKLDKDLDDALGQTFPASDPVSVGNITSTEPPSRPVDSKAPRVIREPPSEKRREIKEPPSQRRPKRKAAG